MIVDENDHAVGDPSNAAKATRATSDIRSGRGSACGRATRDAAVYRVVAPRKHLDLHHLIPRALGGTHDEWNIALACSGHHKLLHQGALSITGRAPDALVFTRDGKRLVDRRSTEARSVDALRSLTTSPSTSLSTSPTTRNRFADVARFEHAKQALRQLGLSARAARAALEQASAHVDANADVANLVQTAFELSRPQSATRETAGDDATRMMATQALVQLGYPRPVAIGAVNAARVHVGTGDLATLIKDALQRTGS